MSSFETLQERLAALQETTGQLKELIERLATLRFQPEETDTSTATGTGTGPDDLADPAAVTELSAEIGQILRDEEEDLELLREHITDLRAGRPGSETAQLKARLTEGAQRLDADLRRCRTEFRKAQLAARRSLDAARAAERERERELLVLLAASAPGSTPSSSPGSPTRQESTELFTARDRRRLRERGGKAGNGAAHSDVVAASSDVTDALRRTHALIAGEVAKSAFATQTLAQSTAALRELQQTYDGIEGLLVRSRDLVGTLLSSQKSDTWYLRTAFYVLLATLTWLVFRRFLYGPLWWFVWLPARTTWRTGRVVTRSLIRDGDQHNKPGAVGVGIDDRAVPVVDVVGSSSNQDGNRVDAGVEPSSHDSSMVDKVARIVEDSLRDKVTEQDLQAAEAEAEAELEAELALEATAAAAGNKTQEEAGQPNPLKRIWEEDADGQAQPQAEREVVVDRIRDEL